MSEEVADAKEVIRALRAAHDELAGLIAKFDEVDLASMSGSRKWTVAQVLSHLGSGSVITLALLESTLGVGSPPTPEFNKQVWARWDALEPEEQASEFVTANAALVEQYESIPPDVARSWRLHLPWLPASLTLAEAARMRLSEVALHSWDVRISLDLTAVVAPDATRALLHGEPSLVSRIGHTDVLAGREETVEVTTTDPASTFSLVLGEQVSVVFDNAPEAKSVLALPAEAWLRLVAGRLAPEHTPSGVESHGPVGLDVLREVFPGY